MNKILQYLKMNGQTLDTEIAATTGISLPKVHLYLSELFVKGEIVVCLSTRFEKGKKIDGISCRLVGYTPPAPSRGKPKSQSRQPQTAAM